MPESLFIPRRCGCPALVALLSTVFAACSNSSGAPSAPSFSYATSVGSGTTIKVAMSDGSPVVGAIVQIQDHLPEPGPNETREELETGNLYLHGQTDADGVVQGLCKFPIDLDTCDVLITSPEHVGPYTFESHRSFWGATAPSARVQIPVEGSLTATIIMEVRP
ncbi:MAG: hypothetical protein VX044_04655 [Planctomycetota bacterium]|nr:hypothetical protein [Planctomycetota bacterium]